MYSVWHNYTFILLLQVLVNIWNNKIVFPSSGLPSILSFFPLMFDIPFGFCLSIWWSPLASVFLRFERNLELLFSIRLTELPV